MEKFNIIQVNADETDESNLNDTECENNSEDDNKNKHLNKELRNINHIPIRRKRALSYESEEYISKKIFISSEEITNNVSKSATKNINNNDGNSIYNIVVEKYYSDDEGNSTIIVGKRFIKEPQKNKVQEVNNTNSTNENECNGSVINLSNSDLEIPYKVLVHNKKSLESVIQSCKFILHITLYLIFEY